MSLNPYQPRVVDPNGQHFFSPSAFEPGGKPPVDVHERPPSGGFAFRVAPGGTNSAQILQNNQSFACRKIILYAPGPGSDIPNINSIYFAIIPSGGGSVQVGGPNTAELPPGATAVIDIQDVKDLYFVSQNLTDVVTGFVEANL